MTLLQAILLGLVQGSTEFIPISSSGHMILIPWLLGWGQPGLLFSIISHLGTATSILIYFRDDWLTLVSGTVAWARRKASDTQGPKLLLLIGIGVIPAAVVGLLLERRIEPLFLKPVVPAILLLVTAAILILGELAGKSQTQEKSLTVWDGFIIGIAQVLALLPGISRSGTTIAAGVTRRLTREDAARYSFLLATPLIVGATILQLVSAWLYGIETIRLTPLIGGYLAALVSGLAVIHWLLSFLRTRTLRIFALYCLAFGMFCLVIIFVRTY